MKKEEVRELKEITLNGEYKIPGGHFLLKEPTKICENGNEVFKIVIAKGEAKCIEISKKKKNSLEREN